MTENYNNNEKWLLYQQELSRLFSELSTYDFNEARSDLLAFHYDVLVENYTADEYQKKIDAVSEKITQQNWDIYVPIVKRILMRVFQIKIELNQPVSSEDIATEDDTAKAASKVDKIFSAIFDMLAELSEIYQPHPDMTEAQNAVNELIFDNRKNIKNARDAVLLYLSFLSQWDEIEEFTARIPLIFSDKKIYFFTLVHKAFKRSLTDPLYTVFDLLLELLADVINNPEANNSDDNEKKEKTKQEEEDEEEVDSNFEEAYAGKTQELADILTLITAYLKKPAEIRFFLENHKLVDIYKKVLDEEFVNFVFNEDDSSDWKQPDL